MALTNEQLARLHKPFPASKISFKIQRNPKEDGKQALIVAYIDARDVMERLDEVVGGDWSDSFSKAATPKGIECQLTVCGTTRSDVGDDDNQNEPTKSGYSDAFKRAAVKFGVGRFLYELPVMWGDVKKVGNSYVIEDATLTKLQETVTKFLADQEIREGKLRLFDEVHSKYPSMQAIGAAMQELKLTYSPQKHDEIREALMKGNAKGPGAPVAKKTTAESKTGPEF